MSWSWCAGNGCLCLSCERDKMIDGAPCCMYHNDDGLLCIHTIEREPEKGLKQICPDYKKKDWVDSWKKYRLTDETKVIDGHTLHRIESVADFGSVRIGDKGGFVESERNLSKDGDCWIYDNAAVYESAFVNGDSQVYGYSKVHGNAIISNSVSIYGRANIFGNAFIYGKAYIGGYAEISGDTKISQNASVCGDAKVLDYCVISDFAYIGENARVDGKSVVWQNAKVYGNAHVGGNALVRGFAKINGFADVEKASDYLEISPIGSRNDTATFFKLKSGGVGVTTGCFCGTLKEFFEAVRKTHGNNEHAKNYRAAALLAKMKIQRLQQKEHKRDNT